jgi:hypothetical protein
MIDMRGYYFIDNNPNYVAIRDIRMPLFVLAVFYAGLLMVTADKKEKTK